MRFPPEFIERVRDATNIAEVIGAYTELKGPSFRMMGRCPFPDHNDKSPSFSVSVERGLFHCFGCKKGGNVFHFLEIYNGMTFPEAIEYLAKKANIPIPEPAEPAQQQRREDKDQLYDISKKAAIYYYQSLRRLKSDDPIWQYIQSRGLSREVADLFKIGFAPPEWQGLVHHLGSKLEAHSAAERLGLLKRKKLGGFYDAFRGRLMFPIISVSGEVLGFGGRAMSPDDMPKYINSPESPIFHKGKTLYGLRETAKYIREKDQILVVEGYLDAISLYAAGVRNVAAILGTAFTPDHAKACARMTRNIVILLDGDSAGLTGAERSLSILLAEGLRPRGILLTGGQDPDDFVRKNGGPELQKMVESAEELFSLVYRHRWKEGYRGDPSQKAAVIDSAAPVLREMREPTLQNIYVNEIAKDLEVAPAVIWRQIRSQAATPVGKKDIPSETMPVSPREKMELISLKGAPRDEAIVVSMLLNFDFLIEDFLKNVGPQVVGVSSDRVQPHNLQRDMQESCKTPVPQSRLELISHPGLRRVLGMALERLSVKTKAEDQLPSEVSLTADISAHDDRQNAKEFAKLAALLVSYVDDPSVLMRVFDLPEFVKQTSDISTEQREKIRMLMNEYFAALERRQINQKAKNLVTEIRSGHGQALTDFVELVRSLRKRRSPEADT